MRAAGGGDEGAGRHRRDVLHGPRQIGPQRFGPANDMAGVLVPGGFTACGQVVQPGQRIVAQATSTNKKI